jgi:hypothetical protein
MDQITPFETLEMTNFSVFGGRVEHHRHCQKRQGAGLGMAEVRLNR